MTDNHMVVAALIATVAFTAGFTMPGGYIQSGSQYEGMAVLCTKSIAFQAFIISDTIALIFSTSALFIYFIGAFYAAAKFGENDDKFGTYAVLQHALALAIASCVIACCAFLIYSFYGSDEIYAGDNDGKGPFAGEDDKEEYYDKESRKKLHISIHHNLHHFRFNYTVILFLSLPYHSISIIVFLITLIARIYFYLSRDEPIVVFDHRVDELIVLALLSVVTLIALILTWDWLNVFISLVIGVTMICLHGAVRGIDDDQESGYKPLLSVVDG
ncbi:hypothetical protein LguiA_029902 [Lonicera macranthoides]